MLGDIFDRGHEAKQVQQFVLEQMEQDGEVRCASKTQYLQGCHTAFADGRPSYPGRHEAVLNSITMQKALCVRILCTQRTFLDRQDAHVTARAGNSSDRSSRQSFSAQSLR